MYDYAQNEVRLKLTPAPDIGIRSLTIAQNASQLVAADSSGVCHHYHTHNMDLNADTHYQKFEAHQDYILKVQLSADQKYLATCSADKIVKLWTLNEKGPIPKWEFDKSLFGTLSREYLRPLEVDLGLRVFLRLGVPNYLLFRLNHSDLADGEWRRAEIFERTQAGGELLDLQRHSDRRIKMIFMRLLFSDFHPSKRWCLQYNGLAFALRKKERRCCIEIDCRSCRCHQA